VGDAPVTRPLGLTLGRRLRELAEQRGETVFAATSSAGSVTFADLDTQASRAAALLSSLGVRRGDAVHVQLGNRIEYLVCLFGITRLGAVIVPTNPSATADDIAYITSHAECTVSVVDAAQAPIVAAAREMAPEIGHVLSVGASSEGMRDFAEALEAAEPGRSPGIGDETDLAAVLYTSGTIAWPKGVMLTHRNLLFAGDAVASHLRIRPDDRWLVTLPLFHMNALGYSTMSALSAGASVALVEQFEPTDFAAEARRSGATLTSLFAVHARRLLATPSQPGEAENALRLMLFAQHLTPAERATLQDRFGPEPLQVYGLTETIAPTIGDAPYGVHRADTIGRATVWASVRVVDRAGHEVPDGVAGELLVGGEPGRTLMAGYYRRPDETALVMRDGWLRTGDRMVHEHDGHYRFLGRAAEVIKPGVDNVSAPEIERVLYEHVSVVDAAVVGVQNESGDESIVAFVVLQPDDDATPEEILGWARERLADYKVPERVVMVPELPRNAVGKVLKRELQRHWPPPS
jgi:acyl-CoA synthetase (AMP-forming)/AMP-acid ligase II